VYNSQKYLVTMKTFNKLQSKNIYTVLKFGKTQPIAVGTPVNTTMFQ